MSVFVNDVTHLRIKPSVYKVFYQALQFYESRYGQLIKLPDRYHTHARLTSVSISDYRTAIWLTGIQYYRSEYYWLVKLYFVLRLPEDWTQTTDPLGNKLFVHSSGVSSDIRPAIFYILRLKQIFEAYPTLYLKMKMLVKTNYANYFHVYRDPNSGKANTVNIKKYLFSVIKENKRMEDSAISSRSSINGDDKPRGSSRISKKLQIRLKANFMKTMTATSKPRAEVLRDRNANRRMKDTATNLTCRKNGLKSLDFSNQSRLSNTLQANPLKENDATGRLNLISGRDRFFLRLKKAKRDTDSITAALNSRLETLQPEDKHALKPSYRVKIPKILHNAEEIKKLERELLRGGVILSFSKLFKGLGKIAGRRKTNTCPLTGASLLSFSKLISK